MQREETRKGPNMELLVILFHGVMDSIIYHQTYCVTTYTEYCQPGKFIQSFFFNFKYLFIYLFGCSGSSLWYVRSLVAVFGIFSCDTQAPLVAVCGILVAACEIQFPDQRSNLDPLHWDHGVLTTELPGKSLIQPLRSRVFTEFSLHSHG